MNPISLTTQLREYVLSHGVDNIVMVVSDGKGGYVWMCVGY
jgi:hypothetical protein